MKMCQTGSQKSELYTICVESHLPIGESGFDYSTLSNFRDRLLQNKKEQEVFQEILKKAAERKLIPQNSVRQIIDSTCTLGTGAVQDTYTLIRKSIYKLIQELQKHINIVEIVIQQAQVFERSKIRVLKGFFNSLLGLSPI